MPRDKHRFVFQTTIVRTTQEPISPEQIPPPIPRVTEPTIANENTKSKLSTFWNSTPLWGGITMLLGAIFSHFSVLLVYSIAWLLGVFEFIRVGFFKRGLPRVLGILGFAVGLVIALAVIWKITPSPRVDSPQIAPSLDQQANVFLDKMARRMPWLAEKPTAHDSPPPSQFPMQSGQYGHIEVYFGSPSPSRGTEVKFKTDQEKRALFAKGAAGGAFTTRLLPGYSGQKYQQIPIIIRNISNTVLQNGSITISSDHMMDPITAGERRGKGVDLIYDFPQLRPYTQGAEEITIFVQISTNSTAFDPTPLLVTVNAKGMQVPHSEIAEYAFMPLPA